MKSYLEQRYNWVREYFRRHPQASVDEAAREAKRVSRALHKSNIARVRRDVLAELAGGRAAA